MANHSTYMLCSLHWYLAIICNPEYILQPPPLEPSVDVAQPMTRKRKRDSEAFSQEAGLLDGDSDGPTDAAPPTTDSNPEGDPSASASRTASAAPSVSASASVSRPRSPVDEVVPDSENERDIDPVTTQRSDESKQTDEREVESLLDAQLQRALSISEPRLGNALSISDKDNDVEMRASSEPKLAYPDEEMDVDVPPEAPRTEPVPDVSESFPISSDLRLTFPAALRSVR